MSTSFEQQRNLNRFQNLILESQILEISYKLKPDAIFTNKDLINYKSFQLSHKVLQFEVLESTAQLDETRSKKVTTAFDLRTIQSDIKRLHEQVEKLKSEDEKPLKWTKSEKEDLPLLLKKYQMEKEQVTRDLKWARYQRLDPKGLFISLVVASLPIALLVLIFELMKIDDPDSVANVIVTYSIAGYFALCVTMLLYLDYNGIREKNFDIPVKEFWSGLWDILTGKY